MKNIFWFCISLTFLLSCGEDPNENETDFDRTELLANLSNNIIIPAYLDFIDDLNKMNLGLTDFINSPNQDNLDNVRTAFANAYTAFQNVSPFEFGPAETSAYRANLNTFPTDIDKIEMLINNGNYNLDVIDNYNAKGFPALDFLLYKLKNTDAELIDFFDNDINKTKYAEFILDITADISNRTGNIYASWMDGYKETFESNKNNDVGSSISIFVNAYIQHYESRFRSFKIGLPAGVFFVEEMIRPELLEAYYSGISIDLIKANFNQLQNIYLGGTAEGIDDHLIGVDASELNTSIINQLDAIKIKLNDLTDPLSEQIVNDKPTVLGVYAEIQRLVPLLKADLVSVLSITITFMDGDGD